MDNTTNENAVQTPTSVGTGQGKAEGTTLPNGMVLNFWPSTTGTQPVSQTQPANIGSSTLPAKNVEEKEEETEEETSNKERPIKKLGKEKKGPFFTPEQQAKVNEIDKIARQEAEDKVRAEFLEKERLAKEEAEKEEARKKGELDLLLQQEEKKSSELSEKLKTVKTETEKRVKELEETIRDRDAQIQAFNDMIEEQIDRKISAWPEEIVSLDPKELYPDSYTLNGRVAWVNKAEKAVDMYIAKAKKAEEEAKDQEESVQTKGNGPTPPPVDSKETEDDFNARYQMYRQSMNALI